MRENGLKSYADEMFELAQKYQQRLMRSKEVHITIDAGAFGENLYATICCNVWKDGKLTKTERFEINERGGFDAICAEMSEFVEFILPYLP